MSDSYFSTGAYDAASIREIAASIAPPASPTIISAPNSGGDNVHATIASAPPIEEFTCPHCGEQVSGRDDRPFVTIPSEGERVVHYSCYREHEDVGGVGGGATAEKDKKEATRRAAVVLPETAAAITALETLETTSVTPDLKERLRAYRNEMLSKTRSALREDAEVVRCAIKDQDKRRKILRMCGARDVLGLVTNVNRAFCERHSEKLCARRLVYDAGLTLAELRHATHLVSWKALLRSGFDATMLLQCDAVELVALYGGCDADGLDSQMFWMDHNTLRDAFGLSVRELAALGRIRVQTPDDLVALGLWADVLLDAGVMTPYWMTRGGAPRGTIQEWRAAGLLTRQQLERAGLTHQKHFEALGWSAPDVVRLFAVDAAVQRQWGIEAWVNASFLSRLTMLSFDGGAAREGGGEKSAKKHK